MGIGAASSWAPASVGSVVPPHATPATTSVAPPKTMAARVALERGEGSDSLRALPQNGQLESEERTWREHDAQSFKDILRSWSVSSPPSNGNVRDDASPTHTSWPPEPSPSSSKSGKGQGPLDVRVATCEERP